MAIRTATESDARGDADNAINTSFCANSKFLVYAIGRKIIARQVDHDGHNFCVITLSLAIRAKPQLALSDLVTGHLAISHGSQVSVYNLNDNTVRATINGVGRCVSSLAWSRHNQHELATGLIDGSICLWSLQDPTRPIRRLISASGVCCCLSFSPDDQGLIVSAHSTSLAVWSLRYSLKPEKVLLDVPRIQRMIWHPHMPGRLLTLVPNKCFQIWSVALGGVRGNGSLTATAIDRASAQGTTELSEAALDLATAIEVEVLDASWSGANDVIVLLENGIDAVVYEIAQDGEQWNERHLLSALRPGNAIRLRETSGTHILHLEAPDCTQSNLLGPNNYDALQVIPAEAVLSPARRQKNGLRFYLTHEDRNDIVPSTQGIYPDTLSSRSRNMRRITSSGSRSSGIELLDARAVSPAKTNKTGASDLSGDEQQNSLLRVTRPTHNAKHVTIVNGADVTDSAASLATQASHDSDSDEEVFGHEMSGSGNLVPDGVNVPIPRACGALFAPNGQLITFFPSRPRVALLAQNDAKAVGPATDDASLTLSRLFPTFGNLLSRSASSDGGTDSQGADVGVFPQLGGELRVTYNTDLTWNRMLPVQPSFENAASVSRLVLQIRSLDDLLQGYSATPLPYRFCRQHGESWAEICEVNAKMADESGLIDAGLSWHLLARVLTTGASAASEFITAAKYHDAKAGLRSPHTAREGWVHEMLPSELASWADHPFGASWLIKRILEWTEQRADIQLLAYLSALLLATQQTKATEPSDSSLSSANHALFGQLEKEDHTTPLHGSGIVGVAHRNSSSNVDMLSGRALYASHASSRTTSQPTTPYLESSTGTPPSILRGSLGESAKMLLSGSASPEHHRASFSAAARHYAQSITEKFYAYGSSPPVRNLGVSPTSHELSTSLPAASASWSKSVSFASTAETTRESNLSTSFTVAQDGYDSDKTVEDSSGPETPGSGKGFITVKLKHEDAFTVDQSSNDGGSQIFSSQLKAKLLLWRATYANQLRSTGSLYEATELEQRDDYRKMTSRDASPHLGVVPSHARSKRRPVCGICLTNLTGLKQICPECLHATHLGCLETLLDLQIDEPFACPSGCGCRCLDLACEPVVFEESTQLSATASQRVRRKASFTDPRRWRARVEGDSW